jgi:hypothetical protein
MGLKSGQGEVTAVRYTADELYLVSTGKLELELGLGLELELGLDLGLELELGLELGSEDWGWD